MSKIFNNTTNLQEVLEVLQTKATPSGSGTDTSDATATESDIFSGKTAYAKGGKITGTFTIEDELTEQDDLIAQIQTAVNNLPDANNEVELPELENPASANEILNGYQAIDGDGNLITGTLRQSGGGGGSVETCTVTLARKVPLDVVNLYYTDPSMNTQCILFKEQDIIVAKNTIIAIDNWTSTSGGSGSCTELFYEMGKSAFSITGNCTLTFA